MKTPNLWSKFLTEEVCKYILCQTPMVGGRVIIINFDKELHFFLTKEKIRLIMIWLQPNFFEATVKFV